MGNTIEVVETDSEKNALGVAAQMIATKHMPEWARELVDASLELAEVEIESHQERVRLAERSNIAIAQVMDGAKALLESVERLDVLVRTVENRIPGVLDMTRRAHSTFEQSLGLLDELDDRLKTAHGLATSLGKRVANKRKKRK